MQTQAKDYWKLFKPSACKLKLKARAQGEAFQEIVEAMVKAKVLEASLVEPAVKALLEREGMASTGVGQNVAIPHVKLPGLDLAAFSLCLSEEGVEWNAVDGEPVHLFFTVLRPVKAGDQHDPDRHLDIMRWISNVSREADFRRFAMRVKTRTELIDLVKEMSGASG